ncbi:hypothetical protein [Nodularia sp. UHCC 0506]|uniref:hypothetical protein n=1 Tax=Nodularia sp. UHCC 0506 TaxID=3110243 RepID=UPI002B208596|nr:hypothetical protein [Nodularia sp. UHCC 0506]MEA5516215.1 hypothetical protein [Nodularia sp. UHCC 0506]
MKVQILLNPNHYQEWGIFHGYNKRYGTKKIMTEPYKFQLHEKLKTFAENYVTDVYAPVGQIVYYWEEWGDPEDDTTCEGVSGFAPPDDRSYTWSEVTQNTITGSFISDSDADSGEYCVGVAALIAVYEGTQDEDEAQILQAEQRTIYVNIHRDNKGDFSIADAEE